MRRLLLACVLLLAGCASERHAYVLDPGWAPLRRVVEDRSVPRGVTRTIYAEARVWDLVEWLREYPPGPLRDALLLHEREHSRREDGTLWFVRYATSASFRWEEEKAGWRLEIRHLVESGVPVDVDASARILSGKTYESWDGSPMVSLAEARAWVQNMVETGR